MYQTFRDNSNKQIEKLKSLNKISNFLGFIKLALVVFAVVFIYILFKNSFQPIFILITAVTIIALGFLWVYHDVIEERIHYAEGTKKIWEKHISRLDGSWTQFDDIGEEFLDETHSYSSDLDIVGPKSLFQLLNTTNTWHGRRFFADSLLSPAYDSGEILRRQEAISELSNDINFSTNVEYYFSKIGADPSAHGLVSDLSENAKFAKSIFSKILIRYGSIATLVFYIITLFQNNINLYIADVILIAIQAVIGFAAHGRINRYLGHVSHLNYTLSGYSKAIDIIISRDYNSQKLNEIKASLSNASKAFTDLGKLSDMIKVNHYGIVYLVIDVLLMWDFRCALSLQNWRERYSSDAEKYFLAIGEFEGLLAHSHLPHICDNTSLPVINEGLQAIKASNIAHPLISNEIRVGNDFSMSKNIFIISGSNMSGKTTFLRTVGINIVLAKAGSFVCAEHMTCHIPNIMTSMRIADDLNSGVSTFYAELKKIKSIVDAAKEDGNVLFLIDEIFRGTNSADRLTGAKTIISNLSNLNAIGLITTHDMELCEIASENNRIKNYNFSEFYADNEIHFDYKLRKGKSKTTNAAFLMKMIGITD